VVHRRYNPDNITAFNIVPGLLGIVLSMTLVMMTALALTRERSAARWRPCWRRRSSRWR
jgi:ABC-2 type transport system permease protein